MTLALLLFSDAARVNLRVLRHDTGVEPRLLLVGLPLTIALGTALAVVLFPDLDPWAAAVIAAAVAPTDAALGAQVVEDEHVPGADSTDPQCRERPERRHRHTVRELLHRRRGRRHDDARFDVTRRFPRGLGVGVLVGAAVGLVGAIPARPDHDRGLASPTYRGVGVLALALVAFALSIELGGNGFISAFVGGLAFGTVVHGPSEEPATLEFDYQSGRLLSLVVWFLFGAVLVTALDA